MAFWKVKVANPTGTKGELIALEADTEADARRIAPTWTPDPIDTVVECEQITETEYKALTTPPTIPPPAE